MKSETTSISNYNEGDGTRDVPIAYHECFRDRENVLCAGIVRLFNVLRIAKAMLMRTGTTICLALTCAIATIPLFAQTPQQPQASEKAPQENQTPNQEQNEEVITAVPNRPTFASTAETVQRGVFEIEYGFEAAQEHQNINGLLKWGMFKNLELWFLHLPLERDAGVAGLGDCGAGFKLGIISQKKMVPKIALLYIATLPAATNGLGAGATGHFVNILLSKDFGKNHFDLNEGVQWVGRPGASGFDRNYFSALSYSRPLTGKWGYTGEIAGFSRLNVATPATMTLLNAATYNVSPRLVLDGGAYFAAYGNLPRVTFFGGVTYSIANLYHLHPAHRPGRN